MVDILSRNAPEEADALSMIRQIEYISPPVDL